MSHAFQSLSFAKSAFKQIKEPQYAGEYIQNKKAYINYCDNKEKDEFIPCKKRWSEGDYLLYKKGKNIDISSILGTSFNITELYGGLITKEDLKGVPVIIGETVSTNEDDCKSVHENIDTITSIPINLLLTPVYQYYTIDPNGILFGKTPCGINNFINFMKPL